MNKYQQLISTLNQLFQTDQEELDFGIYRIMNQKRSEINSFLETDLKKAVTEGLSQIEQSGTESLAKELENVVSSLKSAGVDPDTAPKVIELKKQLNASNATEDAENDIYSHLVDFFSRYYLEGDFISQRRYKDDVYAIPYQGEEVKLYWANYDQYYIKTTENFSNYSFKLQNGKKVTFRLVEASTEQNNNKTQNGQERRFKLHEKNFINEVNGKLEIYFEYISLGKKVKQDDLNKKASEKLVDAIPSEYDELKKVLPTKKNKDRNLLEKRLEEYTSRNTFDYFIHKDLGGFLKKELDFYIKNELLDVDDLGSVLEHNRETFTKIKVFKSIASKIIDFLEQLENFQKTLWEKKKFVTQSDYLITLDLIDERHYKTIATNKDQLKQWVNLGFFDKDQNIDTEYLKKHQFLTLDTQYFPEFKDELLANIENLDESTDGLLMNSENWQALNLLKSSFSKGIDSIYIDPPYNTDSSEICYKNGYKTSSWNSLIDDRIHIAMPLLIDDGIFCVTIDDEQQKELASIVEKHFGKNKVLGTISIRINPSGRITLNGFAQSHEYAIFAGNSDSSKVSKLPRTEAQKERFNKQDEKGTYEQRNFRREGSSSERTSRPKRYFPLYVKGEELRIPKLKWIDENRSYDVLEDPSSEEEVVYPIDSNGNERVWRWGIERIKKEISEIYPKRNGNNGLQIYYKYRPNREGVLPNTLWLDKKYSATEYGTALLKALFSSRNEFSFPKSIYAVEDCVKISSSNSNGVFLDYFAGSGTTGHAVINLNREDEGNRKYVLVEMGKYFDSVTKPRIQKVVYSNNWKNGKPQDNEGVSQIVKYLKLESYEDTLNNLVFNQTENQQSLLSSNSDLKEDYFLRYMLDVETRESSSLLNIDQLKDPFNYSLLITSDNEQKRQRVDVAETFNYLIGLHVSRRFIERNCLVFTGTQHQTNKKVAVIWRNVEETSDKNVQNIVKSLEMENDIVFVNGQTTATSKKCEVLQLEPEFKKRMFN